MCYSKSPLRVLAEAFGVLMFLLSVIPAVFSGNPEVSQATEPPEFSAPYGLAHPLVGTIVRLADPRLQTSGVGAPHLSPRQLIEVLLQTDVILLGEKHDNPDHRTLQTWVLRQAIQAGRRSGVVFEMMTEDQQAIIERYERQQPHDATLLGKALAWESSGWPAWIRYQPLADLAMRRGLPIIAGNVEQELTKNIQRFGFLAIPGTRRERLGLNTPMTEDLFTTMQQDMKPTHCQEPSALQLLRMVLVQHARDAVMAEHLTRTLSRADTDGAVLIAGSWHVRTDYGVPAHLRRMAPEATVHSLAFIEVEDHHRDVVDYAQGFGAETVPFDFVWFTPRVSNAEVCTENPTIP